MIFCKKRDTPLPSWGLRINDNEKDDIIVYDENIALKIISLWNRDEKERFDRQQNMIVLERPPKQ